MNSLQRVLTAATFQGPDRPPVFLVLLQQGAIEMGLPLAQYYSKGSFLADGQTRLLEKYGHDCVVGVPHIVEDTLPFGTDLKYYDFGPPSVTGMSISRYEQILDLKVPRAADHPQLRETLSAIERLAARYKGQVPILGAAIAPFSLPSMIMGTKHFIHLMKDTTGLRQKYWAPLMKICIEYVTQWANDQLRAGADIIVLADGMASADILTPQEFQMDALPTVREAISKISGYVAYEFVGKAEALLPYCLVRYPDHALHARHLRPAPKKLRALAHPRDELALAIFRQQAVALGRLFTIAANFTDPDALFVGGGVVEAEPAFRDWFLTTIREHTSLRVEQRAATTFALVPQLDMAGARGAALAAMGRFS